MKKRLPRLLKTVLSISLIISTMLLIGGAGVVYANTKNFDGGITLKATPKYECSNAKAAYYLTEDDELYKYTKSTKKHTLLKAFTPTEEECYSLCGLSGDLLFITIENDPQMKIETYTYNLRTEAFTKAMDKCDIDDISGKYAIGINDICFDVSPFKSSLYRITKTGLKKIKTIGKLCGVSRFSGGKLFYSRFRNWNMKEVSIYRANKDGSKAKKVTTIKTKKGTSFVWVSEYKPSCCFVVMDMGGTYKYTYKTKKLTKVK